MKTQWDYTELAQSYLKRPDYSENAINELFDQATLNEGSKACDIGAGVAHLTLPLLNRALDVTAVEPNDAMRRLGIERTQGFSTIKWVEGTAEQSQQANQTFDLVTFGSSFNVADRNKALAETKRISKPNAWFAALWNHRDLTDPLQQEIEGIIRAHVRDYQYGIRREDQTEFLNQSGYFVCVKKIHGQVKHRQSKQDVLEAWRSHATLHRQSGEHFQAIISDIEQLLAQLHEVEVTVPYDTRMWIGQLK